MDDREPLTPLAAAAEALLPPGDPLHLSSTALPGVKARRDRLKLMLSGRADRFSQLMSKALGSEFVGHRLITQSELDDTERVEILALAESAAAVLFGELATQIEALRTYLRKLDPLLTTAHISLNHTVRPAGTYHEPIEEGSEASVELVASVFASQPAASDAMEPDLGEIGHVEDALRTIRLLQELSIIAQALAAWDDNGLLRMLGQVRTSAVRGESYVQHGADLAREILRPVETWMRQEFGYSVDEFFAVAEAVETLIVERLNENNGGLADILNALHDVSADDLTDEQRLSYGTSVQSFFEEYARQLIFTLDDVAVDGGLDPAVVEAVINGLSVGVAELDPASYRSPLDPSPLLLRPFLRAEDRYVLPVPGHLLRSSADLFEQRLHDRFSGFSKHRSNTVDRVSLDLLEAVLAGCERADHAYYEFDDGDGVTRYEVDGILVFENFCIVVEGKARRLSVQARRGDVVRLGREIGATLNEAWNQCARVGRYLKSADKVEFTDERGAIQLTVTRADAKTVLFVNPTLHSLGAFAFELPRLRTLTGFAADGQPWPVLVTDLRVITELVAGPATLLHYMQWRTALPIGDRISAVDELDIFGTYLFGGVGELDDVGNDEHTFLASSTSDFDKYYGVQAGDSGSGERPRRVLGDWLHDVLDDLAERRPPSWLERSFAILDLPLAEAVALTSFAENVAARKIGHDRWCWFRFGDSTFVALRAGVAITEVLLEISPTNTNVRRWFVIQLAEHRPVMLYAERRRPQG